MDELKFEGKKVVYAAAHTTSATSTTCKALFILHYPVFISLVFGPRYHLRNVEEMLRLTNFKLTSWLFSETKRLVKIQQSTQKPKT